MLRIIPVALKYDTRYKVTIDAANSPDGSSKASRNSNSPRRNCGSPTATTEKQQSDDMTSYVLVGEVVSSDYARAATGEEPQDKRTKNPDVAWVHSANGTTHQHTVGNIAPGEERVTR